jgi:hypothetical protein
MYIYNVTINVENNIHDEWISWIENHIHDVLATGKFTVAKLTQVLVEEDFSTKTYSIQYMAKTREDLESYYADNADKLRQAGLKKFGDKVLTFRTELRLINEFYPVIANN